MKSFTNSAALAFVFTFVALSITAADTSTADAQAAKAVKAGKVPHLNSTQYAMCGAQVATVIDTEKAGVRTAGSPNPGGGWILGSNGRVGQSVLVTSPGKYLVILRAWGSPAGGVWPEMALLVDGSAATNVTVSSANPTNYLLEAEVPRGDHEIAAAFLNAGTVGQEVRNLGLARITIVPPEKGAPPVLSGEKESFATGEKRENEIIAATGPAIEKNRKSDAVIHVVDAAGKPIPQAKLNITQTSHEFLFGCNILDFDRLGSESNNATYKQRFADLFNFATVGFYWRAYERQRGKPNYPYTDKVVAWCAEHGIRMKGHPLLWGNEAIFPRWSTGLPAPEIQRQRVTDIINRYHDKIAFWEVVNEPSHTPEPKIDEPYRWARQTDPNAYLIVNDYLVMADGAPGFYELLMKAKANGVPFNGIGIQAHEPHTMRFPLDRVQTVLDTYDALGKELLITEFDPASGGAEITGSHLSGVWDEAAQADYAVKFYRVCFAHPSMRAITWWDLNDSSSFLPGGGMLRKDLSPKPVYEQLHRLIHEEWQTSLTGATDAAGRFAFRGFRGAYRVTIEAGGVSASRQFQLAKDTAPDITLVLDAK